MATHPPRRDVQQPDPAARRRAMRWLLVGAGVGAVVLVLLEHWLAALTVAGGARAGTQMAAAFACVSALAVFAVLGLGRFAWRLGGRVQAARRFPLPGQSVLRATVVLEGEEALRRAMQLRVVGLLLVLLGLALLAVVVWLGVRLASLAGAP